MFPLNRIAVYAGIAVLVMLLAMFGVRQYGNARVAKVETAIVTKAVSEAVEQRNAEVKVDVQTKAKRRTMLAAVRSSGIPVEKSIEVSRIPDIDPEFVRLLNDSIRTANEGIESARGLPR